MIVQKYGLTFRRMQHKDIEMIRRRRNSDEVRLRMHEQRYITEKQQEEWFESINTDSHYFFVISIYDNPVGLVQAKNIDYQSRTGEGGIYIWDAVARSSGVGVKASLCLLDIAFLVVNLSRITAKVRLDNASARRHNLSFGYREFGGYEGEGMVLDRNDFLAKAPALRKICSQGKDLKPTSIEDMTFPQSEYFINLYTHLPGDIRSNFSKKIKELR